MNREFNLNRRSKEYNGGLFIHSLFSQVLSVMVAYPWLDLYPQHEDFLTSSVCLKFPICTNFRTV